MVKEKTNEREKLTSQVLTTNNSVKSLSQLSAKMEEKNKNLVGSIQNRERVNKS